MSLLKKKDKTKTSFIFYHRFYNEEIDWIGFVTKQGVEGVKDKVIDLNTGIYLPSFKSTNELNKAILLFKKMLPKV